MHCVIVQQFYNNQVEGVGEKCAATMDSLQSRLSLERETVVSFVTEVFTLFLVLQIEF